MDLRQRRQAGATLVEYAIAAAVLVAIFVIAGIRLQEAGQTRSQKSRSVEITGGTPCRSDGLAQFGADACK